MLPSAKCTRPLFQRRTGCGGRPSGWHDIVTCQRLVFVSGHKTDGEDDDDELNRLTDVLGEKREKCANFIFKKHTLTHSLNE